MKKPAGHLALQQHQQELPIDRETEAYIAYRASGALSQTLFMTPFLFCSTCYTLCETQRSYSARAESIPRYEFQSPDCGVWAC